MTSLRAIIIFLALFSAVNLSAQKLTYLGIEGGPKWGINQLSGQGSDITSGLALGGAWGIVAGQKLYPNLFIESGFYFDQLILGIQYPGYQHWGKSRALSQYQVPIRLKYRFPVYKDRLSFTGSVGIAGVYNSGFGHDSRSSGSISNDSDRVSTQMLIRNDYARVFAYAEMGLSLDYKFRNNLMLSLSGRYNQGFKRVASADLEYTINDSPAHTATLNSKGSNLSLQLGLKVPVSNFWSQDPGTLEYRKQNLAGVAKSTKSPFYISLSGGLFNQENSSDTPGLEGNRSYSRLGWRTPIWALNMGYKFHNNWIIETGFADQQFSNRYMLWEGDTFYAGGSFSHGSDGYYMVPLRIKHQFYFGKTDRFSLIPYIGLTGLISKETGNYASSSGGNSRSSDAGEIVSTTQLEAYRDRKFGMTLNAGLGAEYALTKNIIFFVNADYSLGLQEMNRLHVDYQSNIGNKAGNVFYKGSGLSLMTGVKIPINFGK